MHKNPHFAALIQILRYFGITLQGGGYPLEMKQEASREKQE